MAYARFNRDSAWYIFWYSTKESAERESPKSEEILAIWHSDHRSEGPLFTYVQVLEMLQTSDFSRIPGYSDSYRELITGCLTDFVRDVDQAHGAV